MDNTSTPDDGLLHVPGDSQPPSTSVAHLASHIVVGMADEEPNKVAIHHRYTNSPLPRPLTPAPFAALEDTTDEPELIDYFSQALTAADAPEADAGTDAGAQGRDEVEPCAENECDCDDCAACAACDSDTERVSDVTIAHALIPRERAPELYAATEIADIDGIAFPPVLQLLAEVTPNLHTVRILNVPSSGFKDDWPISVPTLIIFHWRMNYEFGPWDGPNPDEEDTGDAEDDGDFVVERRSSLPITPSEIINGDAVALEQSSHALSQARRRSTSLLSTSSRPKSPLCTTKFVLNIIPSHPTKPKVLKALEQTIGSLATPLSEIVIIFTVADLDGETYTPASDDDEPPLKLFLLTLLMMCGSGAEIILVDFDDMSCEWLDLPDGTSPGVCREVFRRLVWGCLEVGSGAEEQDAGRLAQIKSDRVTFLTREDYLTRIGKQQFALETEWEGMVLCEEDGDVIGAAVQDSEDSLEKEENTKDLGVVEVKEVGVEDSPSGSGVVIVS